MHQIKTFLSWIALIALIFVTSCSDNDAGLACKSDSDCPPSHYCASGGGVLFASSNCVKRTQQIDPADASHTDTDSPNSPDIQDFDTRPDNDANSPPETDVSQPSKCQAAADCDDGVSCTQDSCVNGTCQHVPNHDDCDDGNVCTDNLCHATDGCTSTNNNAPCDDGFFCNGSDLCADGACTFHSGTPCDGEFCNESKKDCSECFAQSDCGLPTEITLGGCVFATECSSQGLQEFLVRTPKCENGTCDANETREQRPCSRTMPTGSCGQRNESPWSACIGDGNICTILGTHTRTITTYTCQNNQCIETISLNTENCTLNLPEKCAPDQQSSGNCEYAEECSETGTKYNQKTTWSCVAGQCQPSTSSIPFDVESCNRSTSGKRCSTPPYNGRCTAGCCDLICPPEEDCPACF